MLVPQGADWEPWTRNCTELEIRWVFYRAMVPRVVWNVPERRAYGIIILTMSNQWFKIERKPLITPKIVLPLTVHIRHKEMMILPSLNLLMWTLPHHLPLRSLCKLTILSCMVNYNRHLIGIPIMSVLVISSLFPILVYNLARGFLLMPIILSSWVGQGSNHNTQKAETGGWPRVWGLHNLCRE